MPTQSPRGAPRFDALAASAAVSLLRFGVFRRHRSISAAGVFPRGLPTRGAKPIEQVPLGEALTRRWDDDRHIVLYTSDRPYRINNAALGKADVQQRLVAFDVDNHDDIAGWMDAERPKLAALLADHPGGFAHTTRRGWRVLYALPEPLAMRSELDKQAFVRLYARIAAYVFERFGVATDSALIRWNQPIRLPHVVRDGRVFDAEILAGDPHALGAFHLPGERLALPDLRELARVVPGWAAVAKQWQPQRQVLRVASSAWDHIPLPAYPERLAAAAAWAREHAPRAVMGHGGRATARSVAAMLHVGFALERSDVEQLLLGSYNHRRCSPPWSESEIDDLRQIAQAVARTPQQTPGFLLSRDRTGIEAARATLNAAAAARNPVPLADFPALMAGALEQHRALVVRATYGAGKTHHAARYIASRTTGRVLVVVPRHELARAWLDALADAGETDVAYHVSVVQRRDAAGRRHCDNRRALALYRRGGDVRRDVCPSCPRVASCPAYAERRPNHGARVHVLPREMLPSLQVTDDDLVVLDDAAVDLLAWHRLSLRQLERLAGADTRMLPTAQGRYVSAFVQALLAGARGAEAVARRGLGLESPAPLRLLAERAVEGQRSPSLPADLLAQGGDELAAALRDASTLREVLRFAAACAAGAPVHWSDTHRTVHSETAVAELLRTHRGQLVVLDAAANLEELGALRPGMHVLRLDIPDAGDVARTLLFAPNAHRTALSDPRDRKRLLDAWLEASFARLTGVRRAVLVTYKALVPELRAHPAVARWLAQSPRRVLRFAHYGAVRGSRRFEHTQAIVTLGDPWLNSEDVQGRAAWLELPDEPAYRIALATAELGQAHGRSRSVRRRRRLTHVHVGRLVPDGWGSGVTVDPLGGPPERSRTEADRSEFEALVRAHGGNRVAAKLLGCSPSAISDWRRGRRSLPSKALDLLRQRRSAENSSASSGEPAGGGGAKWTRLFINRDLSAASMPQGGVRDMGSEEASLSEPRAPTALIKKFSSPAQAPAVCERDPSARMGPPRQDAGRTPAGRRVFGRAPPLAEGVVPPAQAGVLIAKVLALLGETTSGVARCGDAAPLPLAGEQVAAMLAAQERARRKLGGAP